MTNYPFNFIVISTLIFSIKLFSITRKILNKSKLIIFNYLSIIIFFSISLLFTFKKYLAPELKPFLGDLWLIIYIVLLLLLIINIIIAKINLISTRNLAKIFIHGYNSGFLIQNGKFQKNRRECKELKKTAFISYNHRDIDFVIKLKERLEESNIPIIIDIEKMKFGDNIQEFINEAVRETDFTISIISENSLKSAWVIIESLETMIYEKVERKKKYIPIFIDESFLRDDFQSKLVEGIEESVKLLHSEITKLTKKYIRTTNLDNKKAKLLDLRYNIDKILNKVNSSLAADFSNDEKIEENFPKLKNEILSSLG